MDAIRETLKNELAARTAKNPKYSLRSFAAYLEVSPSFLSKILNGKRPVTPALSAKIAAKLGLPVPAADSSPEFRRVELDQFSFIADWYHYAILELVQLPSFHGRAPARAIASSLGISVDEAREAVERLIRLGFLERDSHGRLSNRSGNNTTIGPNIATPATRRQQMQILEKAIDALDSTPIEERSQTSVTLAIPREKLEEARKTIAQFRRKMVSLLQDPSTEPDSVYQLSISFYPLTKEVL